MMTLRQIERLWQAKQYDRMLRAFLEMRPESSIRLIMALSRAVPAAAMAIIRLDELNQPQTPICAQMIRTLLAAQEADGGWGDPMTTALCLHALRCGNGDGPAIDRGLAYLASLQKTEGIWPKIPIRRMAADPFVSAFVLLHLADDLRFEQAARLGDAMAWFETHRESLDAETTRLWRCVCARKRTGTVAVEEGLWS